MTPGKKIDSALDNKKKLIQAYTACFSGPFGDIVLTHMAKTAHVFGTTHVAGDPYQTAFNEGQRHFVLSLFTFVKKDHNKILELMERELYER